ncbi:MAG: crossover junction endodeoxyribonuclease RuvC [Spirochaetes bacterium GWC1_27_15]|nr:MAG: crossover junction endodeoxyribonuclease RuvC [Spirochaetes bacterium GWC1_27_15]
MLVIGVDPGIESTGIGVVEEKNNRLSLVHSELIKTLASDGTPKRLEIIFEKINKIIDSYQISFASVEKLFFAKNVKTAMVVSEARGAILLALQLKNIPIYEYTPLQVKQALIGYGRGTKDQIQSLVKIILNLSELPKQDDVADGIALAITHINSYRMLAKIRKT